MSMDGADFDMFMEQAETIATMLDEPYLIGALARAAHHDEARAEVIDLSETIPAMAKTNFWVRANLGSAKATLFYVGPHKVLQKQGFITPVKTDVPLTIVVEIFTHEGKQITRNAVPPEVNGLMEEVFSASLEEKGFAPDNAVNLVEYASDGTPLEGRHGQTLREAIAGKGQVEEFVKELDRLFGE